MGPGGAPLAEAWKRIVAPIIDGILLFIVVGIPLSIIVGLFMDGGSATSFAATGAANFVSSIASSVIYFLYFWLMIANTGSSVGGLILKIKVINQHGGDVSSEQAAKRSAFLLLGAIPIVGGCVSFVLVIWGLVSLFTDPLRQVPWDKFGETVVVENP
jgi:uncharacterized RDD family membrane protein YckC